MVSVLSILILGKVKMASTSWGLYAFIVVIRSLTTLLELPKQITIAAYVVDSFVSASDICAGHTAGYINIYKKRAQSWHKRFFWRSNLFDTWGFDLSISKITHFTR